MNSAVTLGLVGALLVVAFLANKVLRVSRIPDSLLLMGLGVLLGPVLGLVNALKRIVGDSARRQQFNEVIFSYNPVCGTGDTKAMREFMHPNCMVNSEGTAITRNVGIVMGHETIKPKPDSRIGPFVRRKDA